jgi:hypothetical protein
VSPAGGEVGVGYFSDECEGHSGIIRFGLHAYWIAGRGDLMQRRRRKVGL